MKELYRELLSILNLHRKTAQGHVNKFKEKMEKHGISYAIYWTADDVMKGEQFLRKTNMLLNVLETESMSTADLKKYLAHCIDDAERFLMRGYFRPSTSSPTGNMEKIAEGEAYGDIHQMVRLMEKVIERHQGEKTTYLLKNDDDGTTISLLIDKGDDIELKDKIAKATKEHFVLSFVEVLKLEEKLGMFRKTDVEGEDEDGQPVAYSLTLEQVAAY